MLTANEYQSDLMKLKYQYSIEGMDQISKQIKNFLKDKKYNEILELMNNERGGRRYIIPYIFFEAYAYYKKGVYYIYNPYDLYNEDSEYNKYVSYLLFNEYLKLGKNKKYLSNAHKILKSIKKEALTFKNREINIRTYSDLDTVKDIVKSSYYNIAVGSITTKIKDNYVQSGYIAFFDSNFKGITKNIYIDHILNNENKESKISLNSIKISNMKNKEVLAIGGFSTEKGIKKGILLIIDTKGNILKKIYFKNNTSINYVKNIYKNYKNIGLQLLGECNKKQCIINYYFDREPEYKIYDKGEFLKVEKTDKFGEYILGYKTINNKKYIDIKNIRNKIMYTLKDKIKYNNKLDIYVKPDAYSNDTYIEIVYKFNNKTKVKVYNDKLEEYTDNDENKLNYYDKNNHILYKYYSIFFQGYLGYQVKDDKKVPEILFVEKDFSGNYYLGQLKFFKKDYKWNVIPSKIINVFDYYLPMFDTLPYLDVMVGRKYDGGANYLIVKPVMYK